MTTKFTRANLNRYVKSTLRKPKIRTVKEDYDQHRYDGSSDTDSQEGNR